MNKKFASLFCATLMVGSASLAFAGAYGEREEPTEMPAPAPAPRPAPVRTEVEDEFRPGPYVGVGGAYAWEFFNIPETLGTGPGNGDVKFDGSWGYRAHAGYRIAPMFAVETIWEHFLSFQSDGGADQYVWDLSVNGKFFPITGRIEPYLMGGLGWLYTDSKDNQPSTGSPRGFNGDALAARFAGGVDFYITDNIGIAAEVAFLWSVAGDPASKDIDLLPVSTSVFYRF